MADLDPSTPTVPIIVPDTPIAAQASTLGRDILILAAALPSLLAVLGTRDLLAVIQYVRSVEFAPALGIITLLAVSLWRQFHARRQNVKLHVLNAYTSPRISMTKSEAKEIKAAMEQNP